MYIRRSGIAKTPWKVGSDYKGNELKIMQITSCEDNNCSDSKLWFHLTRYLISIELVFAWLMVVKRVYHLKDSRAMDSCQEPPHSCRISKPSAYFRTQPIKFPTKSEHSLIVGQRLVKNAIFLIKNNEVSSIFCNFKTYFAIISWLLCKLVICVYREDLTSFARHAKIALKSV